MNHAAQFPAGERRMRGLTLIELMISITIGLALMLAVTSAYLGASGASTIAEAQGRMNEDAQAALNILTQQIRMAGNNPKQSNYSPTNPRNPVFDANEWPIFGCDTGFKDVTVANTSSLVCDTGTTGALAVAYEADNYDTVANGGTPTDCLGQKLTAQTANLDVWDAPSSTVKSTAVTYYVADNRFYIADSNGSPSLFCKGSGNNTPQPLVENVMDMKFQYGVAPPTATTSLTVAGYLNAKGIATDTNLSALGTQASWDKVVTVRICLIVRSNKQVQTTQSDTTTNDLTYLDCDGVAQPQSDRYLRRAYTTTVVLRNRAATF